MRKLMRRQVQKRIESYASQLINTHQPIVVAVTGSVGKTSTKLAIAHILKAKFRVLAHDGNYNTEFGLPLSLFELETPAKITDIKAWLRIFKTMRERINSQYDYDVVVLEMGADRPGDIGHFTSYLQPDIGVLTAVAKVHTENYRSVEAIMAEKWELALGSKTVVYNHDDKRLKERATGLNKAIGFGLTKTDIWSDLNEFDEVGSYVGTLNLSGQELAAVFPVLGQQSVYALTAAAAVAMELKLSPEMILDRIASWQQPSGRLRLLPGVNDSRIIDDSYNSSPYAAVAALDTLRQFKSGRQLAILGSMNELGDYEEAGHRLVGKHCGSLDLLVTIGVAANSYLLPAALEAGLSKSQIHECNTPYEAGEFVARQLKAGDTVLVKGSQNGVFAEEAIKSILRDPEMEQSLVRQSNSWLQRKREQFS